MTLDLRRYSDSNWTTVKVSIKKKCSSKTIKFRKFECRQRIEIQRINQSLFARTCESWNSLVFVCRAFYLFVFMMLCMWYMPLNVSLVTVQIIYLRQLTFSNCQMVNYHYHWSGGVFVTTGHFITRPLLQDFPHKTIHD